MSFVPLQGPATLTVTHPPRDSEVEFTGGPGGARDRVVRLPMRGAIPVLSRALRADDAHPSVGLLGGATVLALKLVAAGRIRVSESGDAWEAGPLTSDDTDAVRRLAQARAFDGVDAAEAEARIRGLLDAVADTMTRTPPRVQPQRRPVRLVHADDDADLPADPRVVVSLRVEAPAEQLADGLLTVVLQVHDRDDPGHVTDAATLWEGSGPRLLAPGTAERRHRAAPGGRRLADARPAAPRARARPHRAHRRRAGRSPRARRGCPARDRRRRLLAARAAGPARAAGGGRAGARGQPADDRTVRPGGDVRVRLAAGAGHQSADRRRDGVAGGGDHADHPAP